MKLKFEDKNRKIREIGEIGEICEMSRIAWKNIAIKLLKGDRAS